MPATALIVIDDLLGSGGGEFDNLDRLKSKIQKQSLIVPKDQIEQEIDLSSEEVIEEPQKERHTSLVSVVAMLRGLAHIHQTHHWQSKGDNFYSDHLLFERLYNKIIPQIDRVAEKSVAICCEQAVDPCSQLHLMTCFVECIYENKTDQCDNRALMCLSLRAEMIFLKSTQQLICCIKEEGKYSNGIENMIQEVLDEHEEFVYLLKQRLKSNE